jgi:hypothetical protein
VQPWIPCCPALSSHKPNRFTKQLWWAARRARVALPFYKGRMATTDTQATPTPTETATDQPTLTKSDITQAATNSPSLSKDEFKLGDRTFKIIDLGYDDYLEFTGSLSPLFEGIMSKFFVKAGVEVPGLKVLPESGFSISFLMQFCKNELLNMTALICNMQAVATGDDSLKVTPEWIKKNTKSPWQLGQIVLQQIERNGIINDFADFFVQALPLIMAVQNQKK